MVQVIGQQVIRYQEISSTNDEAKRLIKAGTVKEGAVLLADSQTKGRGKPGSGWFSPPNVGIYLSAIVKPEKNPNNLSTVTIIVAQAVISALKQITGLEGKIKPPNDVLINGKKVCGILVERVASGELIIGIGLNVNNDLGSFPGELQQSATSLKIETGQEYRLENVTECLLTQLDRKYQDFCNMSCPI